MYFILGVTGAIGSYLLIDNVWFSSFGFEMAPVWPISIDFQWISLSSCSMGFRWLSFQFGSDFQFPTPVCNCSWLARRNSRSDCFLLLSNVSPATSSMPHPHGHAAKSWNCAELERNFTRRSNFKKYMAETANCQIEDWMHGRSSLHHPTDHMANPFVYTCTPPRPLASSRGPVWLFVRCRIVQTEIIRVSGADV